MSRIISNKMRSLSTKVSDLAHYGVKLSELFGGQRAQAMRTTLGNENDEPTAVASWRMDKNRSEQHEKRTCEIGQALHPKGLVRKGEENLQKIARKPLLKTSLNFT